MGAADTRQQSRFLRCSAKFKARSTTPAEFIPQFFVQISTRSLAECQASGQSQRLVQRTVPGARHGHKISDGPPPICEYSHSHKKNSMLADFFLHFPTAWAYSLLPAQKSVESDARHIAHACACACLNSHGRCVSLACHALVRSAGAPYPPIA